MGKRTLKKEVITKNTKEFPCPECGHINKVEWQDIDRTWLKVDRVYETRWDCRIEPEGVRQTA